MQFFTQLAPHIPLSVSVETWRNTTKFITYETFILCVVLLCLLCVTNLAISIIISLLDINLIGAFENAFVLDGFCTIFFSLIVNHNHLSKIIFLIYFFLYWCWKLVYFHSKPYFTCILFFLLLYSLIVLNLNIVATPKQQQQIKIIVNTQVWGQVKWER